MEALSAFFFAILLAVGCVLLAGAEQLTPSGTDVDISAAPIGAGTPLSPGRYVVTVAPEFTPDMSERLERALENIRGLKDVDADSKDATLHFTVKESARVRLADLQLAVAKAHNRAVITNPILEGSLTPRPGF